MLVVSGAVVAIVTVTACAAVPVTCTEELDNVHVGGGLATGLKLHVRLTVPLNDAEGVNTKLNCAFPPALMV
jgi:hypothetical protein